MSIPPSVHDLIFYFNSIQKKSVNVVNRLNRVGYSLDFRQLMSNDDAWGNNSEVMCVMHNFYICLIKSAFLCCILFCFGTKL